MVPAWALTVQVSMRHPFVICTINVASALAACKKPVLGFFLKRPLNLALTSCSFNCASCAVAHTMVLCCCAYDGAPPCSTFCAWCCAVASTICECLPVFFLCACHCCEFWFRVCRPSDLFPATLHPACDDSTHFIHMKQYMGFGCEHAAIQNVMSRMYGQEPLNGSTICEPMCHKCKRMQTS